MIICYPVNRLEIFCKQLCFCFDDGIFFLLESFFLFVMLERQMHYFYIYCFTGKGTKSLHITTHFVRYQQEAPQLPVSSFLCRRERRHFSL